MIRQVPKNSGTRRERKRLKATKIKTINNSKNVNFFQNLTKQKKTQDCLK